MATVSEIAVDLIARTASFEASFRRAADQAQRNMSTIARSTKAMSATVDAATGSVKRMLGVFASIYGIERLSHAIYENTVLWQGMQYTLEAGGLSVKQVDGELDALKDTSMRLGVAVQDIGNAFSRFILTGRATNEPLSRLNAEFQAISGAMRVFHLDSQHATRSWIALTEIMTMGEVKSRQFTQQLGRDWPGIGPLIAKTLFPVGDSLKEFEEAMSQGKISSQQFMQAFITLMQTPAMRGALSDSVNSIQAAVGRLKTSVSLFFSEAENPRALSNMSSAVNDLAKTLSDPNVKVGFDNIIAALAKLVDWAVRATGAVGRFGTAVGEQIGLALHGPDNALDKLKQQLVDVNFQIAQIQQPGTPAGALIDKLIGRDPDAQLKKLQAQRDAIVKQINSERLFTFGLPTTSSGAPAGSSAKIATQDYAPANDPEVQAAAARFQKMAQDMANRTLPVLKVPKIELTPLIDPPKLKDQYSKLGQSIGETLRSAIGDYFSGINEDWGQLLRRMAIEAAESQVFSLLASFTGPVGTVAKFLGFGGARANGGPVSPGSAYLVGERGPELFRPNTAGSIVPNGRRGDININVDARGATDPAAIQAAVARGVAAAVNISDARVSTRLKMLARPAMA